MHALGGNARTTIMICCSPSSYNEQETLSSLYFGKRAKKIKNNAVINVVFSAEELTKQLEEARREIRKLVIRLQAVGVRLSAVMGTLASWRAGSHGPPPVICCPTRQPSRAALPRPRPCPLQHARRSRPYPCQSQQCAKY